MRHARNENVHAKPLKRLKLLKPRAGLINTCVENDDWPRAKPGGRKWYRSADRKKMVRSRTIKPLTVLFVNFLHSSISSTSISFEIFQRE